MAHVNNVELVQINGTPHLWITGHVIAEKSIGVTHVLLEQTGPFELTASIFGKTHFLAAGKASRRYTEGVKRGQPLFKKPVDFELADKDLEAFRKRHADFIAYEESWRGPILFDKLFPVSDYPHGTYRVFLKRSRDESEFLKEVEL
jgi:hypothetical protein